MFHAIFGALLALVWLDRLRDALFGLRHVPDITSSEWDRTPKEGSPRVSIIVPARNEEEHLEQALMSLLRLDYPNYEVIAIDDRSTDRTREIIRAVGSRSEAQGKFRDLYIDVLPPGWLGKTHALWRGAQQATGEWLLFTDADVVFRPDALRRAMNYAEDTGADHLVVFPTVMMRTPGERMMMAFFNLLFAFGHRAWKVADPKARDHIGIGAFNLLRASVYRAIGTHAAIRMCVVDDMRLGKAVKDHGFAQRNIFGPGLVTLRWARGAMGVAHNLTKNLFALLSFQGWRVAGSALILFSLHLGPFLGLWWAAGWGRLGYAVALLVIFCFYLGMWRKHGIAPAYFLLHPVSTILFIYILLRSSAHALRHGGIVWRGTKYPLDELKKAVVS